MDSQTMQKLARFRIMARRLGGVNVDIFRMVQDPVHARQMLEKAQEVESENLILLAMELYDALGLLDESQTASKTEKKVQEIKEREDRYLFGARG